MANNWHCLIIIQKSVLTLDPTLLYWISNNEPQLYQSILNADKESAKIFSGHGSAIAQVYNHMIMPLLIKGIKKLKSSGG